MAKKKIMRLKVNILLKNGQTVSRKVKSTKEDIDTIFGFVDQCWKGEGQGGYVNLKKLHISINEIVTYEVKRLRFYYF